MSVYMCVTGIHLYAINKHIYIYTYKQDTILSHCCLIYKSFIDQQKHIHLYTITTSLYTIKFHFCTIEIRSYTTHIYTGYTHLCNIFVHRSSVYEHVYIPSQILL